MPPPPLCSRPFLVNRFLHIPFIHPILIRKRFLLLLRILLLPLMVHLLRGIWDSTCRLNLPTRCPCSLQWGTTPKRLLFLAYTPMIQAQFPFLSPLSLVDITSQHLPNPTMTPGIPPFHLHDHLRTLFRRLSL